MEPALGLQPWRGLLILLAGRVRFLSPCGTSLSRVLRSSRPLGLPTAASAFRALHWVGPLQLCIEFGFSGRRSLLVPRARAWTYHIFRATLSRHCGLTLQPSPCSSCLPSLAFRWVGCEFVFFELCRMPNSKTSKDPGGRSGHPLEHRVMQRQFNLGLIL